MSSQTMAIGRLTIVDHVISRKLATDVVLVATGVALTAGAAQLAVPLWPVPVTGQTLAVLLVGMSLGALRGGISIALYVALGAIGLPIFSDASSGWGVLVGPTGGYLIGFIASAVLTGWLAQRSWDRKIVRSFLAFLAGSVVTFAFGLPWLAAWLGANEYPNDLNSVLSSGLYPFILGGIIKAVIGAGIITLAWFAVRKSEQRKANQTSASESS